MSKARDLSNFISDATVDATEIADLAVTHAKLHTDMNLSSKTLTFAANQISGNAIDGGVISNFASTGIDDNASATAVTILSDGKVGIGYTSPNEKLHVNGNIEASAGFKLAGHPVLTYDGFDGGYATRLGSTGTSTLDATQIFAGGSVQATFKSGNVGIGTTNPGQKFKVYIDNSNHLEYGYRDGLTIDRLSDENMDDASASVPADRYWPQGNLKLTDGNVFNSDSNGPGLSFYKHRDNTGNQYVQAFIGSRGVFGSNNTDLRFYVNSANAANLLPTSPQMLISGANGYVGIGTTSPSVNLEVSDSGNSFILVKNTSSGSGLYIKADTGGDAELQTAGGNNTLVMRTSGHERMRITSDGVVSMPHQCNVSAYPSATTVTISQNSTWQFLQFNSTRWDNNSDYNTSNSRFTAPVTGKYLFGINLQLESCSGIIWTYIVPIINGNASGTSGNNMADFTPPNGTYFNHAATWMLTLSANDYVDLKTIGSGGSFNLKGNTESSYYITLMA